MPLIFVFYYKLLLLLLSSVRPGDLTPPPPVPVRNLYDRLFWYGFDPAESEGGVGDKTVFGGTKGKFSGLSFLQDGEDAIREERSRVPRTSSSSGTGRGRSSSYRYLPPSRLSPEQEQQSDEYDNYDQEEEGAYYEEEDSDDDNDYGGISVTMERIGSRQNDTSDMVMPDDGYRSSRSRRERRGRQEERRPARSSARRQQRRRRRDEERGGRREYDRYGGIDDDGNVDNDNWVSKQVSSWFDDDDSDRDNRYGDDTDDEYDGNVFGDSRRGGNRRRRRKEESGEWSPMDAVNTFLGINNEQMKYQAAMYDEKMGLNRSTRNGRRTSRNRPSRPPNSMRRRPGYAYRYNPDEDEEETSDTAVDAYDVTAEPVESEGQQTTKESQIKQDSNPSPLEKERSWEERAIAAERVPPIVPAWGPSGALGIDARTKAIQDALEDVQTARQKVETKEKKEITARENITILKV